MSSTWSRRAHELSEKEIFAFLSRADLCGESESPCEPFCAPKPLDFDYVSHGAHNPNDNGWHTPCVSPSAPPGLPSTPQSFWQPYSNTNAAQGHSVFSRHVFKQADDPGAAKPWTTKRTSTVEADSTSDCPVQCGITPKCLLLPVDEDIPSTRDGFTSWVILDTSATLERHVACKGSAEPVFRNAYETKNLSRGSKYRSDNGVPKCLL